MHEPIQEESIEMTHQRQQQLARNTGRCRFYTIKAPKIITVLLAALRGVVQPTTPSNTTNSANFDLLHTSLAPALLCYHRVALANVWWTLEHQQS